MGTKPHWRAWGRALSEDEGAVQDVEVQADGSPRASSLPAPLPLDETGFVDFAVAGTDVSGEFRCGDCGYGAVIRRELPPCPMCGGTVWESLPPRLVD
jgi:hypothetical protein